MTLKRLCIVLLCLPAWALACDSSEPEPKPSIVGIWRWNGPSGAFFEMVIRSDQPVSGTLKGRDSGGVDVTGDISGSLNGTQVTLIWSMSVLGSPVLAQYTGGLSKNSITGKLKFQSSETGLDIAFERL